MRSKSGSVRKTQCLTTATVRPPGCTAPTNSETELRQDRQQWAAVTWDPLPLEADGARAYGPVGHRRTREALRCVAV